MPDPTPPTTPPPATPPQAAPPPPEPTPTPPAAPAVEVDPLVEQIAKSFNRVIEPDAPKPEEKPVAPQSTETLGDKMGRIARDQEAAKVEPTPPPVPTPPPTPEPSPAPKTVVKVKPPVQVPPSPPPQVTPPATPPPAQAPPPAPPAEQEQLDKLTPAQRDEYEMAVYAEAHNPEVKGRAAATLQYFKQVDQFTIEHPDSPPDSEEFREFLNKHQPKWQQGERRKIERQMIEENATAKAKAALQSEMDQIRHKQHLMEVQPVIEAETGRFVNLVAEDPQAEQFNPISREVAAKMAKDGYEKAVQDYPVEAKIIAQHVGIAQEYLRIAHDAVSFDPQNETHQWLNTFVANQGAILAAQPTEAKTKGGKVFLPLHEFAALRKANPTEASRYWTMDDKMILQMIGHNATKAVAAEIARLEGAGFKREKKLDKATTPPPTPAAPPPPSPQAQVSATPGAASPSANKHDNAAFLDALVPGASARILGS